MLRRLVVCSLAIVGLVPTMTAVAQTPPVDAPLLETPDELARVLPCDEGAARVLGDWVLRQTDPVYARAVVDLLAAEAAACNPVREAAISLATTMAQDAEAPALTFTAPALSEAIPRAFEEADQQAERLTFSVEPPPRNLTRNLPRSRIYQP